MSERPSNPIPGLQYHTGEMERGLKHLELFGVDYYVSVTPEATERADGIPEMSKLATTGPFRSTSSPRRNWSRSPHSFRRSTRFQNMA